MGLFKKKQQQPPPGGYKCPLDTCGYACDSEGSLQRHMEWKHPEMAKSKK